MLAFFSVLEGESEHAGLLHGLFEIFDDVLGVLQTDAEAEEALLIDLRIVGQLVAGLVVIDDQTLHVAQRDRVGHQLQTVQELPVGLLIAFQIEGDHAGVLALHVLLRQGVLGVAHPLADKGRASLKALAEQEWVLMETEAPYNAAPERVMAEQGLAMRTFLRLQSTQTARSLAQRGPFLTLLPQYSIQRALEQGKLVALDVPELRQTQQVQLAVHARRNVSPQLKGLLEICAAVLRDVIG